MELLGLYIAMLRDPSVPTNRVVRKTAIGAVAAVGFLVYYRHIALQFSFGEPALVTLGLSFLVITTLGIFGGVLAGGFYDAFLKDVGAQKRELTIAVFFAEWLFAVTAPLLGGLFFGYVSQHSG
ncbi:MAG: hypothetical protein ABL900_14060 [Burkholderiaceae bacterium]